MAFKLNPLTGKLDLVSAGIISSQSGPPATTPSRVGIINIDTLNQDVYIASGTSSSSDWTLLNDSSAAANYNNILTDDNFVMIGHGNVLWS